MNKARTVADTILEQLHAFGVDYIFGVSGDAILHLLDAFTRWDKIKFVGTRHESAAGFMASTYAKMTGKMGVCIATSGPGMANLLNGLGDAYGDKVPVLAITGQVPTDQIGTESKQYIDQQRFMEPLAAYSAQVSSAKAITPLLSRAVQTAVSQKAVAHLSIPKDIFPKTHIQEIVPDNPFLYKRPPTDLNNMEKASIFLSQCKRPMILAGRGAAQCREEIKRLAKKWGAGVACSLGAKGVVPESFELMVGGIGEGGSEQAAGLMRECDGLLIIGAMWYPKIFMPTGIPFVQIELEANHIHFDKNLYTAIIGDAKEILIPLTKRITGTAPANWTEKVKAERRNWLSKLEEESNDPSVPIAPPRILKVLEQKANPDAIFTLDTGDHTVWFNRSFKTQNHEIYFSGNWRTLGYGLPAANAAQLLKPNRQVIAVAGDGGFAMTMAELSTSVKYQLPIKIIILNNQSFAMENNKMIGMGVSPFGNQLVNPNFSLIAEAFGIMGIRIARPEELEQGISKALQTNGPALIEVMSSADPTPLSIAKEAVASKIMANV